MKSAKRGLCQLKVLVNIFLRQLKSMLAAKNVINGCDYMYLRDNK